MKIRDRVEDSAQQLRDAIPIADALQQVAAEAELADHEQRLMELEIDASRLSAKYGSGSERAVAAIERVETHKARLPALQANLARSRRPVPASSPRGVVVYGRVMDETSRGLAGLKVIAASKDKDLASSWTGDEGSFEVLVPGTSAAFHLRVVTKNKRDLHREQQTIEGFAGQIVYWELVIPAATMAPEAQSAKRRDKRKARKRTTTP